MEFKSLGALALHLASQEAALLASLHDGLDRCGKQLVSTMKAEIGYYQPGDGPFAAWADLADSTEAHKARMGYPSDAPLEATGEMRDSFTHEVHGLECIAGSKDPKMVWHEFGTSKMPSRSVVGPAALTQKEFIRRTLGHATVTGLIGGSAIHAALGYDDKL